MWKDILAWKDTVSIYIDDTSIRLMVARGKRIKKWAYLQLEPGLVKDAIILKEAEVASEIKKLLKTQDVRTRRVILGCSGLHSLTRPLTLPQLPKAMLAEAVVREARRVLPVPLEQLYLTWRPITSNKGKFQVFAGAMPRKSADSLVKTLREAGLEPYRMTIKPLALTKALDMNDAILVDLQPGEFDIVIMMDGICQPIRTITLPEEEITWAQKLEMITSDLERTIKFYDTNNPDKPLAATVPIYVSGDLLEKTELFKTLSDSMGRPVKALSIEMNGTGNFEHRHLINLAMSIKTAPAGRELSFPISDLNILPAPYCPKQISRAKMVGIPAGVAAAGLIVPLVLLVQGSASDITSLQSELDAINQVTNQKTMEKKELSKSVTELQTKLTAVKSAYEQVQLTVDYVTTQQEIVNGDLDVVLNKAQYSINLDSISESGGKVTISGRAPGETEVLAYARDLDLSDRFTATTVSSLAIVPADKNNEGYVKFTFSLERKG